MNEMRKRGEGRGENRRGRRTEEEERMRTEERIGRR
jgi:hypothetical protein